MSLKAFHLIFITAACVLTLGFGIWAFKEYFSPDSRPAYLLMGIGSLVTTVALVVYEYYFLKKLKKIDFL
jgi:hypothetical protein